MPPAEIVREDQETKTRSLLEQASVLAASPTLPSEIRYKEYTSLLFCHLYRDVSISNFRTATGFWG